MLRFFQRNTTQTAFVSLNTQKCQACWKCIAACPEQVIGKVDLPWHKHALINQSNRCSGCLKCVKVCEFGVFQKTTKEHGKQLKKTI
ncbi:MAG: hypothetical protein K0M50_22280 [Prolixibacteraceae bacterium]|nr:hypothetical protein [Prolixibacteraceae bacterium]